MGTLYYLTTMNKVEIISSQPFMNGVTYALRINGKTLEVVDTFLPITQKTTLERHTNHMEDPYDIGDRGRRWMIGISTMQGCPIRCPFCAVTGVTEKLSNRYLTAAEMIEQVDFVLRQNPGYNPLETKQLKIQTTRMGEPSLNFETIKAIRTLHKHLPNAKIFVSTVGIQNDFLNRLLALRNETPNEDYIQLQFSVHTTNESRRRELQPFGNLMSFKEINDFGAVWAREGWRKITLNFALSAKKQIENHDFDPSLLPRHFNKDHFFIKLSPLNDNDISERNELIGVIPQHNYI
jgi:adenine C2-methylase RlmN of 23S rRNA A2503 and tRNA A37